MLGRHYTVVVWSNGKTAISLSPDSELENVAADEYDLYPAER